MKILKKLVDFFLCMLKEDCVYSIKKFLTYVFSLLVIYLILFTTKDYYQLLMFIGLLLGIRAYERNNDMKVGFKRPKTPENPEEKQVL
jgi:uncharacterized membrane protein